MIFIIYKKKFKNLLRLYSEYKNKNSIPVNEKLEKDFKYFWNIPEIKTEWKKGVIKYRMNNKESSFQQFLINTMEIYNDKNKLINLQENLKNIKCMLEYYIQLCVCVFKD